MSVALVGPSVAPPRRTRRWVAALVVLALCWAGQHLWTTYLNRAPYGPEAVHARVAMTLIEPKDTQPLLDRLTGGHDRLVTDWPSGADRNAGQSAVAVLTLVRPAHAPADGYYELFQTDDRDGGRPARWLSGSTAGAATGTIWDGRFGAIPERYPELHGLSVTESEGFRAPPGMAIQWRTDTDGPVVFTTHLTDHLGIQADPRSHLGVVLAFFSADMHLYWATSVPVTVAAVS